MNLNIPRPSDSGSEVKGNWRNIRWMPNPSTGEVLNLGVVFVTTDGRPHVQVLDYFERLKCLYDSRLAKDASFLIEVTREALLAGINPPTSNVILSEPKFAAGQSVREVLATLYEATVPLGSRKGTQVASAGPTAVAVESTVTVRQFVLEELKRIAGTKADRIINSEQFMQVRDSGHIYHLDIPLQTSSALGTIVSARTKQIATTELTLHRADTDLQIARQAYKRDDLFMYVIRNPSGPNQERVDALLDEFTWKFKRMGVQMKTYADADLVAPDIIEDMPVNAYR